MLITDANYPDSEIERELIEGAGMSLEKAQCTSAEEVIDAGSEATALLVQNAPVPAAVFEQLPNLGLVVRYGVGVDGIDTEAARRAGVWIANVTDYGVEEVAAHASALLLAQLRHIGSYQEQVRDRGWDYLGAGPLARPGTLTLGVVGLGRIGSLLAERMAPWFARVIGYDPYLPEESWPANVQRASTLEEIFSLSNVLSLHLPLTDETQGVVNRALLSAMPDASYIVNTARGGLCVLDDLLWALDRGKLFGAGLDVMPSEPPDFDHPIFGHSNVLCTPHAAWYSASAEIELRTKAAQNVVSWSTSGRPDYVVVKGQPTPSSSTD